MIRKKTALYILQTQPCPVCDGKGFQSWRWNGLEACIGCGHVRKVSHSREESLEKIQQAHFDTQFALQDDPFTNLYENLNARRRLRELRRILPAGQVLEVGVGHGYLLFTLKSAGYSVEGVDLSPEIGAAVQARYGLLVHRGTLETYAEAAQTGTYDLVIMCHVLEHVESLSSTLRTVKRLLKENGILYLAVPNLSSWNALFPGWIGYEPYHVHYFDSSCLKRILMSAGFEVLYGRTFEPLSGWFNTITRSIRNCSPELEVEVRGSHRNGSYNGFIWILYNSMRVLMGIILSPLRWLQSVLGYGEELVLIARAGES